MNLRDELAGQRDPPPSARITPSHFKPIRHPNVPPIPPELEPRATRFENPYKVIRSECDVANPILTVFCKNPSCNRRRGYVFKTSIGAVWVPIVRGANVRTLDYLKAALIYPPDEWFVSYEWEWNGLSPEEQEIMEHNIRQWYGGIPDCPRCGTGRRNALRNHIEYRIEIMRALADGRSAIQL